VVPYAIRGAIWNQGYANMGEGLPYYNNLHSLVRGWRIVWDKPELPVYFHQFYSAGMNARRRGQQAEHRRHRRDASRHLAGPRHPEHRHGLADRHQRRHPLQAKAVPGQRLALHALKNQYGKKVVADGPMFKSYEVGRATR
jgi:sialate O-acetylesterase